ncbi:MAG: molybdopterin-guanine dinucleotide biosynthesis protein MobA [Pseudonocardiales bacterium]|nr:molybdopterin-guanine dinucleotide biosynthesis protein MobA [Pseudonocardiales bacterium]
MSTMSDWIADVCRELGLELADLEATTTQVLDLTADVAHGVARPAAPVTAFLVGLAAGGSARPDETVAELAHRLGERAKAWQHENPEQVG